MERYQAFICVPDAMMDAVEQALREVGVPADNINFERFEFVQRSTPVGPIMHVPSLIRGGIAVVATVLLLGACNDVDRTDEILGLDPDVDNGRDLYVDTPNRACAGCHAVPAFGIESDNGEPPGSALQDGSWRSALGDR